MQESKVGTVLSSGITLGRGIGPLRFGMYPEETLKLLGESAATDMRHPKKGTGAVIHHYPHLGLDLTFDEEDEHRLAYIDIVGGTFVLMDSITLGMSLEDTKRQAHVLGLGIPSEERCSKWDLLCFHGHCFTCWFRDGKMLKLSFGHYWTSDGTPIWPEV